MKDPIIQEIRKIRHELDDKMVKTPKEFDRDIESIRNRYSNPILRYGISLLYILPTQKA